MTSRSDRSSLRQALADPDRSLIATFVLIPRVEIVEALAHAGFDAIVLDLEHGPIAPRDLPPLVAAGQGAGAFVIARVAELSEALIGNVLDSGVDGVIVPHVGSESQARLAVDAVRYPPDGNRSINPYVRSASYWGEDGFTAAANDTAAVLVMVEGMDAVAGLDDICAVPGVDAIFIGPVDLSASMGHPGQPNHPDVQHQIEAILARTKDIGPKEIGTAVGIYCPDAERVTKWRGHGARLCVLSADMAIAYSAFRSALKSVKDSANDSVNEIVNEKSEESLV